MLKRGVIKKRKRAVLEKEGEKNAAPEVGKTAADGLSEQIKIAAEGLYYISESDAEILPFAGEQASDVTKEELLKQIKSATDSPVEERDIADFFTRLTGIQDWFGDEEKETARKFENLKTVLEQNLRNLKVFKVGKIQLDIYAVGLDSEDKLMGIKTKAVET